MIDGAEEVLSYAELVEEEFLNLYRKFKVDEAPDKRKPEIIDSFMRDICRAVFAPGPGHIRTNNYKSALLAYDIKSFEEVCEMYIKLNKRYGGVIKYTQFANLTGYSRYTFYLWHKKNTTNGYIFNISEEDVNLEYDNMYILNSDKIKAYNSSDNYSYIYNNNNSRNIERDKLTLLRFDVIKRLQEEMQDSNTNSLSIDTMGNVVRANNDVELGKLYEPKRMLQQEQIRVALADSQLPRLPQVFNE